MDNRLVRKLERYAKLSADDRAALDELVRQNVRRLRAREDIIREGERPTHISLILQGWACRYKVLEDGRRQIISFFLPGDLCDLNVFVLRQMDHSIGAITPLAYAEVRREAFDSVAERPRVIQAMWWDSLVMAAVQREWTVNLGQRTAFERVAHLLCELFIRLRAVGLTHGSRCELPVTQAELADAIGLTPVHVNRTLQELRAQGLIILQGKELTIPDLERLKDASLFNDNYLHLDHEGAHLDAND
jgi:CRP-like cAMP-binding protein